MKIKLFAFFFSLFSSSILAQIQDLHIVDIDSKKGIESVVVFNHNHSTFAITDANGFVAIDASKIKDSLFFQHQSYEMRSFTKGEIKSLDYKILLTEKSIQINQIVVSANKTEQQNERFSNKVDVLEMKTAELLNPKTSADLLETTGNVFVQKSQAGGGSPIIRGFEANKVLLAVDGIRLNNAIYRGGHLQNAITIDEAMLEKVEIVYGPGSLIYGSDALGGVVHFYTKRPKFSYSNKALVKANAMIRYATINNEKTAHFDINVGAKKFASLSSFSYSDFGDSKTGRFTNNKYGTWGQTLFFVENNDKIIKNSDPFVQKRTAYKQIDLMQKFRYKENNHLNFELNIQFSTSTNIERYDKLAVVKIKEVSDTIGEQFVNAKQINDSTYEISIPKFSDWYYGPQERFLSAFTIHLNKDFILHDNATYILSYQHINESRFKRKFKKTILNSTIEDLNIITFNADYRKNFKRKIDTKKKNYLLYGLELNYNIVDSKGKETDLTTNTSFEAQARYPDQGSTLFTAAIYGKYTHNFGNKMTLSLGARLNHNSLHSKFSARKFSGQSFSNIQLNNTAISTSLNLIYVAIKPLQINALFSTGYRAPNVDDIGKVFEPNENEIVIPNGNLKPEYTFNFELGFVAKIAKKARIDLVGFYTILNNFIQREAFTFNGLDSVFVDNNAEKSEVLANQNVGNAFMTGVSLNAKIEIIKNLQLNTALNYTYGRNFKDDLPLSHIPPLFGRLALNYKSHQFKTSIYTKFSAWKHVWDYSPTSVDNLDEATIDGTPAWATLNLNLSYNFNKYLSATLGVENIVDTHFRPFGSGISASGRNFVFSLRGNF